MNETSKQRPLTPRQQRFVEEYMVDLNASAAARRAGYTGEPNTIGPRLLANVSVAAAISAAKAQRSERTGVTVARVLDDLQRLQRSAEGAGEFAPAVKATELLGRHVGAFEVDNRQRNPLGNFDPDTFFADLFRKMGAG